MLSLESHTVYVLFRLLRHEMLAVRMIIFLEVMKPSVTETSRIEKHKRDAT
jgi:hypothetical protein